MTVAGVDAKFSATWNNPGDFLARIGLTWDATKTYGQLGTISSDFAETKTGSGIGYNFIGIYGWSEIRCTSTTSSRTGSGRGRFPGPRSAPSPSTGPPTTS